MHLAASAYGSTNPYGSISLADATSAADVPWTGAAHSAAADTLATVELVKSIARVKPELDLKLSKLLEEKAG
ncbi:3'-5' exonuclease [Corynebacterium diphtheriae]|nr:3'-5' exonuclease [Corynebacterium diphtheriae]